MARSIGHDPTLDCWGVKGGTRANWELMEVCRKLVRHIAGLKVNAWRLPYHVERGGILLKNAAALCGVGVVGRNNLLVVPGAGPRVRLLSVALEDASCQPTGPSTFDPCTACSAPCREACPQSAFEGGAYARPRCSRQMQLDEAAASPLVVYCRRCEVSCIVGQPTIEATPTV
jgi:epoxyqueuosine reductase